MGQMLYEEFLFVKVKDGMVKLVSPRLQLIDVAIKHDKGWARFHMFTSRTTDMASPSGQ